MAIIDVLKYDGPNDVLVWKWSPANGGRREEELRFGSQLVVNESQEAVFFRGGKILDSFGPGTHTLSAYNLPILTNLLSLGFGGDSPFKAEVFFVNKAISQDSKWGLIPFRVLEQKFRLPIPITARGSYSVRILDSKKFLVELVGVSKVFSQKHLQKVFRGLINEQVKSAFSAVMKQLHLSPFELEAEVGALNKIATHPVEQSMADFGIELLLFQIEAVTVVTEDERVKDVLDSYHQLMTQDFEERLRLQRRSENLKTFSVERSYEVSQSAAESIGQGGAGDSGDSGSGLLGTVLGLGMAMPVANNLSGMVAQSMQNTQNIACSSCNAQNPEGRKFCGNCGSTLIAAQQPSAEGNIQPVTACNECRKEFPKSYKFCPHCGDPYNPCPHCGADQAEGIVNCFDCGMPMLSACSKCGHKNPSDQKFCGECGNQIQES